MKIFVGGCSGVGKSSVLSEIDSQLPSVIHATSQFMSWLGIGSDYEQLRHMPNDEREVKLNQFMHEFTDSHDDFILDSHYSIMVHGVIRSSLNDWVKKIDACILLTAPAEIILSRVEEDGGKNRALFPSEATHTEKLELLNGFQDHLRMQSVAAAQLAGCPYLEISNTESIQQAVLKLQDFIKSI